MGIFIGKAMLSGNEAIARGAFEAGLHFASAYPGTPSTEILESLAMYKEIKAEWSVNEKVAMEVAGVAAIGGAIALCAQKHVGLNVAADPLFSLAYAGVNGALVVVSADDSGMHSSQNEQDNRHYARAAKIPLLEPVSSAEALEMTKIAINLSHEFDTLVLLRTTTRISHGKGIVELHERDDVPIYKYTKNFAKNVLMPSNAVKRHIFIEENLKKLKEYAENFKYNTIELNNPEIGIITSGISYQYAKEVFPNASFLKLGMSFPYPAELTKKFAKEVKKIIIIEEGDDFIEGYVRQLCLSNEITGKNILPFTGEMLPEVLKKYLLNENTELKKVDSSLIPDRPPVLCPGCPHIGMFDAFRKQGLTVAGDIGCYTLGALPPWNAIDTCICMGASISGLSGLLQNPQIDAKKSVAVIGDSTFLHSGITSLIDMVYNNRKGTVVILDNRITAMTGHQQNPSTGKTLQGEDTIYVDLEAIVKAIGVKWVKRITTYDIKATQEALKEARNFDGVSVLITSEPCVLKEEVKNTKKIPYIVLEEKCTSCGSCIRLGCPAISKKENKKSNIDSTLCIGCSMCSQVCNFGAIVPVSNIKN